MYSKPKLERFGTFRELTQGGPGCWIYPDFPWCQTDGGGRS